MAKVPRPKNSRKGPPPPAAKTVANLDKPEPASSVPFNFKVPAEFKREFKIYAAQRGISMVEVLQEAFRLLMEHGC